MAEITDEQIAELRRFAEYDLKEPYGDVLAREAAARARNALALLDDYARLRTYEARMRLHRALWLGTDDERRGDAELATQAHASLVALDAARKGGA